MNYLVKELWLVDIEEGKEKLEIVGAIWHKRMVKAAGCCYGRFI